MNWILLPYADFISSIIGNVIAHVGHWKSANSSIVTVAVGDPAEFGGVAPGGASAGIPGVFTGSGLFFPFAMLLALSVHATAANESAIKTAKTKIFPILRFFIVFNV
jgi:hypothetical protein